MQNYFAKEKPYVLLKQSKSLAETLDVTKLRVVR